MMSSAVLIPENELHSTPPSLKRRQSSTSNGSNKRLRTESGSELVISPQSEAPPTTSVNGTESPTSKRRTSAFGSGVGAAEEKKRGQRLFGSLLGTLSQTGIRKSHKRRDEIEARQRERLKRDDEEREAQHRRKKAELDRVREAEQADWEEEGIRVKHRNMRAMAGFLRTQTEPRLYYKPWEWKEEEEERIAKQKSEVELAIQAELAERVKRKSAEAGMSQDIQPPSEQNQIALKGIDQETAQQNLQDIVVNGSMLPDDLQNGSAIDSEVTEFKDTGYQATSEHQTSNPHNHEKPNHDDHHEEELVEGQEDDVIY